MYEMSLERCQKVRSQLKEMRKTMDEEYGPDLVCDCHEKALAALPDLLERLASGDDLAVEPVLGFYQHCIDAWARDIYRDPVYESHFKAEIAARFIQACGNLESKSLCYRLKLISLEIVDTHFQHIEEHHLSQLAGQQDAASFVSVESGEKLEV